MRRSFRVVPMALALVFGAVPFALAQNQPSQSSLDDLIAKNIQAKGGAEKLKAVQTVRITGKMAVQGNEVGMTILTKRPNLVRQEIAIQDKTIVQAYDGTTAWQINPMMGSDEPQLIPGPQAQAMKEQADFEPVLLDWKAKGHKVELVGTEQIDAKNAVHLKITKKSGQVQHYYLDPETGLEVRVTTTVPTADGQGTIASDLSDYKAVDGMMVPFALKQSMNGTAMAQMTVEKVEFNVPADESVFRMPKK